MDSGCIFVESLNDLCYEIAVPDSDINLPSDTHTIRREVVKGKSTLKALEGF